MLNLHLEYYLLQFYLLYLSIFINTLTAALDAALSAFWHQWVVFGTNGRYALRNLVFAFRLMAWRRNEDNLMKCSGNVLISYQACRQIKCKAELLGKEPVASYKINSVVLKKIIWYMHKLKDKLWTCILQALCTLTCLMHMT